MNIKTLLMLAVSFGVMTSCSTSKVATTGKEAFTPEMQKTVNQFPSIDGFEKRVIFLSELSTEEAENRKIEIIPGRQMMVDCNQHGLQGNLVKNTLDKFGYDYYQFNSNGQLFSTLMACPDAKKTAQFVKGETKIVDYRSTLPYVVYTAPTIDVKYALWKGGDTKSVKSHNNKTSATQEAIDNLKAYPEKEGYVKHVLYLPPVAKDGENNRKVEIIAGKTLKVDNCNTHRMSGKFSTDDVEGWGYSYWVFESNGMHMSTRMACPDNTLQDKFVSGESTMLRYNSRLPIVIYTPAGFEVNYKIWETDGKMH